MVGPMRLITRKDLGWPPSAAPLQTGQIGVKIHYEGTRVPVVIHKECASRWTSIRNAHLANKQENYSDVAYNFAVCQHGYVLEGRGIGRRTGANGNQELNRKHYAVLVMIGSSGDTRPSEVAIQALREVIRYLREHGAGNEIKGHRDGFATSCPGDALYALVKSGALEPKSNEDGDMEPIDVWLYKGEGEASDAYAYLRNTRWEIDKIKAQLNELEGLIKQLLAK
jgi:hypothetical protein